MNLDVEPRPVDALLVVVEVDAFGDGAVPSPEKEPLFFMDLNVEP